MKKLHLTTTSDVKSAPTLSVFIYTEHTFIQEVPASYQTQLLLADTTQELTFVYGDSQQTLSMAQLSELKQQNIQLTEHVTLHLRLTQKIPLLDQTNLILGLLAGVLAIGYSIFSNSNWRTLVFLFGSTIIVQVLCMILYKHPIQYRHYTIRMVSTISALLLIFFLIPTENWSFKTLIGLAALTVSARFIKDYKRSLALIYNPFIKP